MKRLKMGRSGNGSKWSVLVKTYILTSNFFNNFYTVYKIMVLYDYKKYITYLSILIN